MKRQRGSTLLIYLGVGILIAAMGSAAVLTYRSAIARAERAEADNATLRTVNQEQLAENANLKAAKDRADLIEQIDAPERIYNAPANEFVYTFIGESCGFEVVAEAGGYRDTNGEPLKLRLASKLPDGRTRLYVRPARFRIGEAAKGAANTLKARLHFAEFLGDFHRYHVKAGAVEVFCDASGPNRFAVGDDVTLGWDDADMKVFR